MQRATQDLPARGHFAKFADELFPGLSEDFKGLLEISTPEEIVLFGTLEHPVALAVLKLTTNQRDLPVLATLPIADLTQTASADSLIFPQIGFGDAGGTFSTQLILINPDPTRGSAGDLSFLAPSGDALLVPLGPETNSEFPYLIPAGGGTAVRPGIPMGPIAAIVLDPSDPDEVVVNEGQTLQLAPLVLDGAADPLEYANLTYTSLSPEVATVDAFGTIEGLQAGFSTLTVSAGETVKTATITVVEVTPGASGFEITGITQDLANQLYLANSGEHTIMLAASVEATPEVYAGIPQTSGLEDDERLKSRFQNPAHLALDQAGGRLYVSDEANHVIRVIDPGPGGQVQTLAGTGQAGSADGALDQASFNQPQGIILDNRGALWVVDSANHTIRRIDLVAGQVETIAGSPGIPGLTDGTGDEARFNLPAGIALETELLLEKLQRERSGEPPPPITVVVADAGNGVLRRVTLTGEVTTVGAESEAAGSAGRSPAAQGVQAALTFNFPTALGIDLFGNIYVAEPGQGQVTTILRDGKAVPAAQADTFVSPNGIAITASGRLIVTDSDRTGRELAYGAPAISSVTPEEVPAEGGTVITLKGENFAPDSLVVVAGVVIPDPQIDDTQTITLVTPVLPSGRNTVTVQNRGGLDQIELRITSIPFSQLSQGEITTVAGGTTFSGDGSPATEAGLSLPRAMALDRAGNLFVADTENHRVRKIDAVTGIITTVVGTGEADFSGDGDSATAAALFRPSGVAVDAAGNLFIADSQNKRIRKVDQATGIITTVAGTGEADFSGDGGPATQAALSFPLGVIVDAAGNLLIADSLNTRVRKVDLATGIITTVAGGGEGGDGPATEASLTNVTDLALDSAGNLFIPDVQSDRVVRVDAVTGIITTVAGAGDDAPNIDGIPAAEAFLHRPRDVAVDTADNLFILEGSGARRVRKVDAVTGIITTVAGAKDVGFSGDGGLATEAVFNFPERIAVDGVGNLYIADSLNDRIRKVDAVTGIITTVAGSGEEDFLGDGGPATEAVLRFPQQMAFDGGGNFLIADSVNERIRKVDLSTGIITTVAGRSEPGFSGDGELATEASLNTPKGVAVDAAGNVYIGDHINHRIRRVDVGNGIITTLAGNGERGFSGDGGPATAASLNKPRHVAIDAAGNLLITDISNHRVRKVDLTSGIITTVAGNDERGFSGDGGPASEASLNFPRSVKVDAAGNLFIIDSGNHRVRRVDLNSGIITTVAGNGERGLSGDGGPATEAAMNLPVGLAFDQDGNLFVADYSNNRIRKVDTAGIITTVVGSGATGSRRGSFSGDGGPATEATLYGPGGVAFDAEGNLYIVDLINSRIRAVRGPIP